MLSHSFSAKDLLKLITYDDYQRYEGIGEKKAKTFELMTEISRLINAEGYKISTVKETSINDNKVFTVSKIEDDFALRRINDSIKRYYKVKQADRNLIINQIIALLQEAIPMSIIKLDLKSFYESIDRYWILDKIKDDTLLSGGSIKILEDFFELDAFSGFPGLPRGIGISANLI
ncbi:hypothetical protein SAMN04487891_108133 [Flagellimonas taeanensis]|uniref:Reverse transcriptase domain-containing protein n=1 Tax=Flagellimonas taeanensis TaxID=1005926 RepID=A0A1I1HYY8_9FLAO|nr:hypothetical protein [Allomuricauda taeanensis]SFC28792.1 hypothetical protein SAMN04487891_108133 [Allomuricauda taeanensis]